MVRTCSPLQFQLLQQQELQESEKSGKTFELEPIFHARLQDFSPLRCWHGVNRSISPSAFSGIEITQLVSELAGERRAKIMGVRGKVSTSLQPG